MKTPSMKIGCPIEALMRQAEDELSKAEMLESQGKYDGSCFHAQQAAELSVKALSLKVLDSYDRTHTISDLLKELVNAGVRVPNEIWAAAEELSRHYLASRYTEKTGELLCQTSCEVACEVYTFYHAVNCTKNAEIILNWVKKKLREPQK